MNNDLKNQLISIFVTMPNDTVFNVYRMDGGRGLKVLDNNFNDFADLPVSLSEIEVRNIVVELWKQFERGHELGRRFGRRELRRELAAKSAETML